MAVARSGINHTVRFDVRHLLVAIGGPRRADGRGDRQVSEFERAFATHVGAAECVAFPLARAAFHAALRAMDLPPRSEVILPPITIPAMVEAVVALGHDPVFVDIDPSSLVFDPQSLRSALSPRTGAAMITYLFGIAADPTPLIAECRDAGVFVIEDFSHDLGATVAGRQLGTFGDVGIYSSSATKTLDTYGGGLAVTDDPDLSIRLRAAQAELVPPPRSRLTSKVARTLVWNLATRRVPWTLATFPLIRFLRRHRPELERTISGAGSPPRRRSGPNAQWYERFTALQARAGLELLPLVAERDRVRASNAEQLRATLRFLGIRAPGGSPAGHHVHWQCVGYIEDVERVQRALARSGADAAPTNLPMVCDCADSACRHPVGAAVQRHALYLPCHPEVRPRALQRIAECLVRTRPHPAASLPGPEQSADP